MREGDKGGVRERANEDEGDGRSLGEIRGVTLLQLDAIPQVVIGRSQHKESWGREYEQRL